MDSHKKSPRGRCHFTGKDTGSERSRDFSVQDCTARKWNFKGLRAPRALTLLTNPSHPKEQGSANASAHPMRFPGLRPRYANDYSKQMLLLHSSRDLSTYGLLTGEEMWSSCSAQRLRRPKRSQTPAFKNVAPGPCKSTARGCKTPEQNCLSTHLM